MNLPNWITLSRLFLCVPFLVCLELPGWERAAFGLFVVAALTDWVDGYLARKLNLVTDLGKLLDPLVDKVLVTGAFVALAAKGVVPAWSVTTVLFREFLVTGLRALEAAHGVIIPAGLLGKLKAVLQMVAIAVLLFQLTADGLSSGPLTQLGLGLYWLAVFMTVLSGLQYLWLGRGLLVSEKTPKS